MNNHIAQVTMLASAVQTGRADYVSALVTQALENGVTAEEILQQGLLEGMRRLGIRFRKNEVYVPEVLVAARALNAGTALLRPILVREGVPPIGRVLLATVKGDIHDVGKNLVKMMMEGAGIEVVDLGVDVSAQTIVSEVQNKKPQILALSSLLTSTMDQQRLVIEALTDAGLRGHVKVMIGGAPITQKFCDLIGADAFAPDAASGAEIAKKILADLKAREDDVNRMGKCATI
jgi:5-methyltetrahydrofolate--homocysteine methyltransferase